MFSASFWVDYILFWRFSAFHGTENKDDFRYKATRWVIITAARKGSCCWLFYTKWRQRRNDINLFRQIKSRARGWDKDCILDRSAIQPGTQYTNACTGSFTSLCPCNIVYQKSRRNHIIRCANYLTHGPHQIPNLSAGRVGNRWMDCQWNQKSFVFDRRQSVKADCILYKCFHFTTQQRKPLSVLEGTAK